MTSPSSYTSSYPDVQRMLEEDDAGTPHAHLLAPSSNSEMILFCEAPSFRAVPPTAIFCTIITPVILIGTGILLSHTTHIGILVCFLLFLQVSVLFIILYIFQLDVFGYQVVTNHRAAKVLPTPKFCIFRPGLKSAHFVQTLPLLRNGLHTDNKQLVASNFACFKTTTNNKGSVVINGVKPIYFFVQDSNLLESTLVTIIKQVTTDSRQTHFEMKTYISKSSLAYIGGAVGIIMLAIGFAVAAHRYSAYGVHLGVLSAFMWVLAVLLVIQHINTLRAIKDQRLFVLGNFANNNTL